MFSQVSWLESVTSSFVPSDKLMTDWSNIMLIWLFLTKSYFVCRRSVSWLCPGRCRSGSHGSRWWRSLLPTSGNGLSECTCVCCLFLTSASNEMQIKVLQILPYRVIAEHYMSLQRAESKLLDLDLKSRTFFFKHCGKTTHVYCWEDLHVLQMNSQWFGLSFPPG